MCRRGSQHGAGYGFDEPVLAFEAPCTSGFSFHGGEIIRLVGVGFDSGILHFEANIIQANNSLVIDHLQGGFVLCQVPNDTPVVMFGLE